MSRVAYEWLIETVAVEADDADCDIIEVDHATSAAEMFARMKANPLPSGERYRYGIVRDVWTEAEGITDRAWCYVDEYDGTLPDQFEDAGGVEIARVPKALRAEFDTARAAQVRT